ncbi:unnamed protein product [Chrysoparadoxa australica]
MNVDIDKAIDEALNEGKGWSDEDRQAYLDGVNVDTHPFFAEKVEDMDPELAAAFQALTYEDETPESLAEHFKEEGNKRFSRAKLNKMYLRHSQMFYTEALRYAVGAEQTRETVKLRAVILANRAAANLGMKNYGSVKADCDESLRLVPCNVKCYFRKARAMQALRQYEDAVSVCEGGLKLCRGGDEGEQNATQGKALQKVLEQCQSEIAAKKAREEVQKNKIKKRCGKVIALFWHCQGRGIKLGPPAIYESHHYAQDDTMQPVLEGGAVRWPIQWLYPQHGESDCMMEVDEGTVMAQHLATMFPEEGPPVEWDEKFEYRCSQLVMLVELSRISPFTSEDDCVVAFGLARGLRGDDGDDAQAEAEATVRERTAQAAKSSAAPSYIDVHPACTLLDVLKYKDYVLAGGCVMVQVMPRSSSTLANIKKAARSIGQLLPSTVEG